MITTVEKVLFLKRIDLFSQIASEDLAQIAQITEEMHIEEGEEVFHEGEPGNTLFFIVDGHVRIHRGGTTLATLGERSVFGEMSLLDMEPRSATVTVVDDVTLLRIERDDFHDILAEKAEIAQGIIMVLSRRLRRTLNMNVSEDVKPETEENNPAAKAG
ncbi:MAG: cyclic nucleotide-binding protein [Myxococcales bacterium]|nr:cyclic nucleotide-binding protein [Myxococcales bacterium]|tara:strand:- start:505 stop:981 length:477 start_codon:yes stop_codon:yes gene_type:complete